MRWIALWCTLLTAAEIVAGADARGRPRARPAGAEKAGGLYTVGETEAKVLAATKAYLDGGGKPDTPDEQGRTRLFLAAARGYKAVAALLIGRKAKVNVPDRDGNTPLHAAAHGGHTAVGELLLDSGADPKATDEGGQIALHVAASRGQTAFVRLLLSRGADVKAKNDVGQTPLHHATGAGSRETVELLLAKGADVNAAAAGRLVPLHTAAYNGHADVLAVLIANGADVKQRDIGGNTALHWAASRNRKAAAEVLIAKGAPVDAANDKQQTPLRLALQAPSLHLAKLLLCKGADGAKAGLPPLVVATIKDDADEVRRLLQKGGNANAKVGGRSTLLHLAASVDSAAAAAALVDKGADLNAKDDGERTPLHLAVEVGAEQAGRVLIEKGANVDAVDKRSRTPLHVAVAAKSDRLVRLLIDKGADVNAHPKGGTRALNVAVLLGHSDLVKLLLDKGADVNPKGDGTGGTALHGAVRYGRMAIAQMLLLRGADVDARDSLSGETPLFQAARAADRAMAELLLLRGADVSARDRTGQTPLHFAVNESSRAQLGLLAKLLEADRRVGLRPARPDAAGVIKLLIAKGADVDAQDRMSKETPLHVAARQRDATPVRLLLEAGARTDIRSLDGKTAVDVARKRGTAEIVALLQKRASARTQPATRPAGPKKFVLTSPSFATGRPIPVVHTGDGKDLSPPLAWANLPKGTRELALIVDDPDAPGAEPWVHWVIYGIPADVGNLPRGVPTAAEIRAVARQGKNSWGALGYRGPAPGARRAPLPFPALCARQGPGLEARPGQTRPPGRHLRPRSCGGRAGGDVPTVGPKPRAREGCVRGQAGSMPGHGARRPRAVSLPRPP